MRLAAYISLMMLCLLAVPALAQDEERVLLIPAETYLADVETRYNVCVEELLPGAWPPQALVPQDLEFHIPYGMPPCINAYGQRLNYYDASRQRLDVPQYSTMKVIIYSPQNLPGICAGDLVRANPLTDEWGFFP